jgi:hypothetical protein
MTTETVYRNQIRPVLLDGTDVMDRIFPDGKPDAWSLNLPLRDDQKASG